MTYLARSEAVLSDLLDLRESGYQLCQLSKKILLDYARYNVYVDELPRKHQYDFCWVDADITKVMARIKHYFNYEYIGIRYAPDYSSPDILLEVNWIIKNWTIDIKQANKLLTDLKRFYKIKIELEQSRQYQTPKPVAISTSTSTSATRGESSTVSGPCGPYGGYKCNDCDDRFACGMGHTS